MTKTSYSAVVVTRNRADALSLSLPLLMSQSRAPEEVIVVDSSDDPSQNIALIEQINGSSGIPVRFISSKASMTYQRNIGLESVRSDVVLFPDDDSLLYPDTMADVMDIYDRDESALIGGVGAGEALTPPPDVLENFQTTYTKKPTDRLKARVSLTRYALEQHFVPDPFIQVAAAKQSRLPPPPDWLKGETAHPVPWITGFRMSFRTDVIRRIGFDEKLGRYALGEDVDAGIGVQNSHYLIGVRTPGVYHHKAPARRSNGRAMGAIQILNCSYVIAKSGEATPDVVQQARRHSRYKLFLYALSAQSEFGRARLMGARAAFRHQDALLALRGNELEELYLQLRDQIFGGVD